MYAALMIDLKKSRDYSGESRQHIQQYILELTKALNVWFSGALARRVEFSAGDEIQGLFDSPQAAYLYYRMFDLLVSPVPVRAGIGVGSWDVQISGAGTTAQDGRAYHNARRAIDAARQTEDYDVLLYSGTGADRCINGLIGTGAVMTAALRAYQKDLLLLTELCAPLTARGVPEGIGLAAFADMLNWRCALAEKLDEDGTPRRRARLVPDALTEGGFAVPVAPEGGGFYPTGGRQRGIASRIAKLLGVSRQSVEKSLKNADIYAIRNLAVCALEQMERLEGEMEL